MCFVSEGKQWKTSNRSYFTHTNSFDFECVTFIDCRMMENRQHFFNTSHDDEDTIFTRVLCLVHRRIFHLPQQQKHNFVSKPFGCN